MYKFIPPLVLLYLLPSLLNSFKLVDGPNTQTGKVALNVLLPVSLLLLTMTIDFQRILKLSKKAVLVFLAGTLGIVVGGPIALYLVGQFSPDLIADHGANSAWKGMVTITGSWINGTPGQTSMKEIFGCGDELYFVMLAVDAFMQNIWMALLFIGARKTKWIDKWLKADTKELDRLFIETHKDDIKEEKETAKLGIIGTVLHYLEAHRLLEFLKLAIICLAGFFLISFFTVASVDFFSSRFKIEETSNWYFVTKKAFWLVFYSTTTGILLSFTRARKLDDAGATRIGNFLLYFIIATIGLKMDIFNLSGQWELVLVCAIWLIIHFIIIMAAARLLKAPFFFVAVGSQANIGGPATASMVASAFNPHLASMGVLLGVFSNIIGNYCGLLAGMLFRLVGG